MARMLSLVALCVAALLVCAPAARAQPQRFGASTPGAAATTTGCAPAALHARQHARALHACRAAAGRSLAHCR
jgi:hypothetical protein